MAKNKKHDELRQQALTALSQGRAEMSSELHHLRKQLAPARMMHGVVDRHAILVVALAFTAGIVPAWLLSRGKRSPGPTLRRVTVSDTKAPPKPLLGAVFMAALGVLGKSIAPALIRSAILPRVLASLAGKGSDDARNAPPALDRR